FNISLGRSVCRGLTKVNISENPLLSEAWPDYWSLQPVAQAGLPSPSIDSSFAGHPGLPDPAARGAAGGGADVAPRRRPRPPAARQCASGFIKRRISGHARPCKSVELWLGSTDTVLIRRQGGQPAIRPGGGIRGVITGYSSASARRLLLTVRNMPNHNIFVTFTYPRAYPANGRICKEHLHRVKAYMKRQGADSGCWFLEFQERGAPHFHCYIKDRIEILGLVKAWNRIITGLKTLAASGVSGGNRLQRKLSSYRRASGTEWPGLFASSTKSSARLGRISRSDLRTMACLALLRGVLIGSCCH